MDERNATIPSRYFERREITLADDEIVLVACMRNELLRLPYFLDHYRRLGVTRFLLVDNDSTDGTRDYLLAQPDVEYFHTAASFRGSNSGRLWNHELTETYAMGHWVLTPDLDEMFVFPGAERFGLRELCHYLDQQGYEGVFAPMIDMYSDRPLSQTRYEPGADLIQVCPFFDPDSYVLQPMHLPPFLSVRGGPRGEWFDEVKTPGPLHTKVPLIKWREGFSYIAVAHSHRAVQLADLTGALLHFKLLADWPDKVVKEIARGDRHDAVTANIWPVYAEHSSADLCFFGPHSLRYGGPRDLVRLGVLAAPAPLSRFFRRELVRAGEDPARIDDLLPPAAPAESQLTLRSVAAVWPLVQNPAIMRHFGRDEPRSQDYRVHLVQELRQQFTLIDILSDEVLVKIQNPALHRWRRSGLALALYVGDRLAGRVMADGSAPGLEVAMDSLETNVCRWPVDVAAAAKLEAPDGGPVEVSMYLCDGDAASTADPWPKPEDALVFAGHWHQLSLPTSRRIGVQGRVQGYQEGELRGWVYDRDRQTFEVPLSVYVNDRLVAHARPDLVRRPLAERLDCPPGVVGLGFRIPVSLGYFRDAGVELAEIAVRVAGTNLVLGRTPLELHTDARTAEWSADRGWIVVSDENAKLRAQVADLVATDRPGTPPPPGS